VRDVWIFDLDGCLIDGMTGRSLRPLAAELLDLLRNRGVTVVLWSAGGAEYARRKAEGVGIDAHVAAYYAKAARDDAGRWCTAHLAAHHREATFVDDLPAEAPLAPRLIGVSPYIAENPHDRGLAAALAVARDDVLAGVA
jgi:phosphoglycolate phosphatase-like HAD superfamily hydrolase